MNLDKIKKDNARLEKKSPYNFCDRWCEKCAQEKRDRCKVYQKDFDRSIHHIMEGEDPYDMDVVMKDVKEDVDDTMSLIKKWAEEEGVDLSQNDESAYQEKKRQERGMLDHRCYKLAMKFMRRAHGFLKEAFYDSQDVDPSLFNDYKSLSWYHTLLPAKVNRFLCDVYVREEDGEYFLHDAVAQMDIARKCIIESERALKNIQKNKILFIGKIKELFNIIDELNQGIISVEKDILNKLA